MNPIGQKCDPLYIDDYLAGDLDVEQQEELEAHLAKIYEKWSN